MSRLASFKGPSTPSASPVPAQRPNPNPKSPAAKSHPKSSSPAPDSPSRPIESTYHRKTRTALLELRAITETWDDLVLLDSLKAARGLVDARTELDNALALLPAGTQPRTRLVGPKLALMDRRIAEMDAVSGKLQKQFQRMNAVIDGLEVLLVDAHRTKGYAWATEEPLWVTWSLERFVTSLPTLLPPYHRALHAHRALVDALRSHAVPFEDAREALRKWPGLAGEGLEDSGFEGGGGGGMGECEAGWEWWEDLCEAEVGGWSVGR